MSLALAVLGAPGGPGSSKLLPTGAVAAWYADQYSASPRRVIPNALSSSAVSQNLFPAPRRLFANTIYYASTALTITDDAAAGPDGTSGEASTIVASGATWLLRQAGGGNVPAGTYTLACWAKRNTGTDQTFCFSKDNTATRSSTKTATSTWQRFTYTFTLGSSTAATQFSICNDGSTSANLQICDLELFSGSSDLGGATGTNPAGHCYLGSNHYATQPAVASNELDLSNQGYGQVQLPSNLALSSGMTFVVVCKKTAAGSGYHGILSKMQSYSQFTLSTEVSKAPVNFIGSQGNYAGEANGAGPWELLNQGYHVHTMRYDGSNRDWFLDDCLLHRLAGSVTTQNFRDMHLGIVNDISLYSGEKVFAMALWNRALSDTEVRTAASFMQSRAATASLSASNHPRIICNEGDSITGASGVGWANYYGTNLATTAFLGHNFAISGSMISHLTSRAATVDLVLPPVANRTGRKFILTVLIGANDLQGLGATTWLANLKAYLQARRTAGWTVVACTPTPRTTAGFNTERALVLPTMRGWGTADGVDYLIDFAADATMGPDAAASDTLLYGDGTHPTTAGHQNLANIAKTVLNAI